ncbi:ATP-binding protein [Actinosynnema sp. NPDC053489]|uniref:ATP-binding protein n=1 Tax=Actinosynnema sp. NPDC053489 TaxID=3363916 RepID=UPI0037C6D5A7
MEPSLFGVVAEFSAPCDRGAAGLARVFTRGALARLGYDGDHDDVVLVVSELVSNALRHTATVPVIRLAGDRHRVRVEVADGSPVLPRRASGEGWGLLLIQRLTTAWGATPAPGGKVVWCEMAADPGVR